MKETIVTINKTKNWFFERIKIDKSLTRLITQKERRVKSTKLQMIEMLEQTMQKYKRLLETTMNNYTINCYTIIAIKW